MKEVSEPNIATTPLLARNLFQLEFEPNKYLPKNQRHRDSIYYRPYQVHDCPTHLFNFPFDAWFFGLTDLSPYSLFLQKRLKFMYSALPSVRSTRILQSNRFSKQIKKS
ncbi:unnamed protein product [Albugo candida]|uniref:Uncharacterized protein n=1 Tax=Albugo candida TaxID=65357 RepID=A0A024FUX1_9STRA|nr:unnamed protein product [Albugo candida]|eukprot:CCI10920.1 unnamed protein product [Albugo candida]